MKARATFSAERQCHGKNRYATKKAARVAAKRAPASLNRYSDKRGPLEEYRCPHCGYWHVGHPPPTAPPG